MGRMYIVLNKAYNTLSDETLRFEYDCARNSPDHDLYDEHGTSEYEYKGDMFERMVYQVIMKYLTMIYMLLYIVIVYIYWI